MRGTHPMASYPKAARRRAAGEGSIFHLPSENRWRAALTWTDDTGKRHKCIVSGKTQADVRRKLGALRAVFGVGWFRSLSRFNRELGR